MWSKQFQRVCLGSEDHPSSLFPTEYFFIWALLLFGIWPFSEQLWPEMRLTQQTLRACDHEGSIGDALICLLCWSSYMKRCKIIVYFCLFVDTSCIIFTMGGNVACWYSWAIFHCEPRMELSSEKTRDSISTTSTIYEFMHLGKSEKTASMALHPPVMKIQPWSSRVVRDRRGFSR